MSPSPTPPVRIEPWSDGDLDLLRRCNAPEMTEHLGGPETDGQVVTRHQRYLELGDPGSGRMFRIVLLPEQEPVGNTGYWERIWRAETVYETGWHVLPAFQGRGIAAAATAAVVREARAQQRHRGLHAFPSIANPASNAICRKLDFTPLGSCEIEYPPGQTMRVNDWRLELRSS